MERYEPAMGPFSAARAREKRLASAGVRTVGGVELTRRPWELTRRPWERSLSPERRQHRETVNIELHAAELLQEHLSKEFTAHIIMTSKLWP